MSRQSRVQWTPELDAILRDLINKKIGAKRIAEQMKIPVRAVHSRAMRLHLSIRGPYVWTEEANNNLIDLYNKGLSYNDMAAKLGKSWGSISHQSHRLRREQKENEQTTTT